MRLTVDELIRISNQYEEEKKEWEEYYKWMMAENILQEEQFYDNQFDTD